MRVLLDEDCEQVVNALGRVLLGQSLANIAQQHTQLGVHVELLGSECVVDLLLIARTVANLIVVLGTGEVYESIVWGVFLGTVQIIQCTVVHAIMLE